MSLLDYSKIIHKRSELYRSVVEACQKLLLSPQGKGVKDYADSRLSKNQQNKFNLGYFPEDHLLGLLFDQVGEKSLKQLKLIYDCASGGYRSIFSSHNMIMPIKDDYGNIVALVGRTLKSSPEQKELNISKYKYSLYNKSLYLFGLYQAKTSIIHNNSVIIVEGQIDCISCHSHGFHNVVALGGSSLGYHQLYLLNKYTNNFYLLLDNDQAGERATDKIIKNYGHISNIRQLKLEEGYKDIDEYLKKTSNYKLFDLKEPCAS